MTVSTQPPDSQFAYVVIAGRRARQLMSGASPLLANPRSYKPTRVAMEELNAGQLEYDLPEMTAGVADRRAKD